MKKQILKVCTIAALSLTISNVSYGQIWNTIPGTPPNDIETHPIDVKDVIIHNNLMIGTTTPQQRLTVNGNIAFDPQPGIRHIIGNSNNDGLLLMSSQLGFNSSGLHMHGQDGSPEETGITFWSNTNGNLSGHAFRFQTVHNMLANTKFYIGKNGDVGIGTETPDDKLTISGDLGFTNSIQSRYINGRSTDALAIFANTTFTDGAGIYMSGAFNSSFPGRLQFTSYVPTQNSDAAFEFAFVDQNNNWEAPMTVRKNGKVTIGNDIFYNTPGTYLLYVEQGILTEKIKVAVKHTTDWADYVFADNYELTPLNEVESYVKENKHLPNIPSAEEVVNKGVDLGAMNAKLLEKIEELTLYVIDQQKQIDELKNKLDK